MSETSKDFPELKNEKNLPNFVLYFTLIDVKRERYLIKWGNLVYTRLE